MGEINSGLRHRSTLTKDLLFLPDTTDGGTPHMMTFDGSTRLRSRDYHDGLSSGLYKESQDALHNFMNHFYLSRRKLYFYDQNTFSVKSNV